MGQITVTIDDGLIERARERARREETDLSAAFQKWLEQYAGPARPIMTPADYEEFMRRFSHIQPGGPYTRDELNER